MQQAAQSATGVVHFSECAISGYASVNILDSESIDWDELAQATREILDAAEKWKQWVLLGSTHRLSSGHKPHSSVNVISPRGTIVDRYDKPFYTGTAGRRTIYIISHRETGSPRFG